jgi:uncharacterized membrane protein YbaN (DUF454 family)
VTEDPGQSQQERSDDGPNASAPAGRLRQIAALAGAVLCLTLAVLGFFLPLIPCTPFVLLASFLLMRSSPAMHRRLRQSRFFGRILTDWEEKHGIQPRDKVRAIIVVVAGLLITTTFGNPSPLLQFLILFFVTIGLWVIVRLPIAVEPGRVEQPVQEQERQTPPNSSS